MAVVANDDFAEEDTAPGEPVPAPESRDEPSYELMWVEEPGLGMVLRVRKIARDE
jgi:hypothetical protein